MDNYAAQPGPPQDMVPGEQYRYALSNFVRPPPPCSRGTTR